MYLKRDNKLASTCRYMIITIKKDTVTVLQVLG